MIDVSPEQFEIILDILQAYAPDCEVRAFGSRYKWTAKDTSDLDIVLVGERKRSLAEMARLREAFEESALPFRVDVLDWLAISAEFREVIERGYEVIQKKLDFKEWKKYKLKDIAIFHDSKRVPLNSRDRENRKGKYPYYGASGVVDYIDDYIFDGDFVLISEDGENLRSRTTPIAFKVSGKFWVNNHAHVIQGKEPFLNDWIIYFFQNFDLNPYITGAVQPKLNRENLELIEIPIPEFQKAKGIVAILSSLDEKIELNRQTNATLEAIAQAIFKEWFVNGVQENWEVKPVSDLVHVNPPRSLKKGEIAPYLDMANMPTQGHRAIEWIRRPFGSGMRFINGDTLLARITPCLENGKTAFVDFLSDKETGWGSTEFIVLHPKPPLPVEFGYYLARDESFRNHVIQNMIGTSGRQRAPASCLEKYVIPTPPATVARKFGDLVRPIMSVIRANDEESRTLASLRDILLPKLMSGEIAV